MEVAVEPKTTRSTARITTPFGTSAAPTTSTPCVDGTRRAENSTLRTTRKEASSRTPSCSPPTVSPATLLMSCDCESASLVVATPPSRSCLGPLWVFLGLGEKSCKSHLHRSDLQLHPRLASMGHRRVHDVLRVEGRRLVLRYGQSEIPSDFACAK